MAIWISMGNGKGTVWSIQYT